MKLISTLWRFFAILSAIFLFMITSAVVNLMPVGNTRRRIMTQDVMRFFSNIGLSILGVKPCVSRLDILESRPTPAGYLIVANHLSYVDVMVMASLTRTVFVTSVEIKNTFGLGTMARLAGCIFVERRSRSNLEAEICELSENLISGQNVTVFPEATSTNGDVVLPFKKAMFRSVEGKSIPVLPISIRYLTSENKPLNAETRDSVHWYGTMSFLPHLWRLCSLGDVPVRLDIKKPFNGIPYMCRRELAEHAHTVISGAYASGVT